jgi:hypothetical protein
MTKRRAKGDGSVYGRGDGRVVGEYLDANGKRRYVSGKTKPEVKAKLRRTVAPTSPDCAGGTGSVALSRRFQLRGQRLWLVCMHLSSSPYSCDYDKQYIKAEG